MNLTLKTIAVTALLAPFIDIKADSISPPSMITPVDAEVGVSFSNPFTGQVDGTLAEGLEKGLEVLEAKAAMGEIQLRGAGQKIYKGLAPSVVLITTGESIGSGAVIDDQGTVLTNWHVVGDADEVGVFLKPPKFENVRREQLMIADVLRIDQVADLALIRLREQPENVTPFNFGTPDDVEIAMEVHAIGHPHGQAWTYTQGIVSQIRPDYEWKVSDTQTHRGDVIQTQTPINPGNSGGPLIADNGNLIGINSFVNAKAQGLNYAVAITEIENFLKSTEDRMLPGVGQAAEEGPDLAKLLNHPSARPVDTTGDGRANGLHVDYNSNGVYDSLLLDTNGDGLVDEIYVDRNENGKPDLKIAAGTLEGKAVYVWYYDTDENGSPETLAYDLDTDGKIDRVEKV